MKREILFRGKSKNTGKWLYGDPVKSLNDKMYMIHGATEDAINTRNEVDFVYSEVDPESVGQYTGLLDRNGDKVFEGDVLEMGGGISIVVWDDAAFAVKNPGSNVIDWPHSSFFEKSSIIGNIHDNPELLK